MAKAEEYTLESVKGKEKVDSLKEVTTDVKNISLAVLLLHVIGEMEAKGITLSFPNISVGAWKMFPKIFFLFGWDMPDSKRVSTTLWHLTNTRSGGRRWLTGTITEYILTEKGRRELSITAKTLKQHSGRKLAVRRTKPTRQVNNVRKTPAFINYKKDEEVTEFNMYQVLQCTLDSDTRAVQENFHNLHVLAEEASADDVVEFLDFLEKKFEIITRSLGRRRLEKVS